MQREYPRTTKKPFIGSAKELNKEMWVHSILLALCRSMAKALRRTM
jgi:hypothetical protein